MRRSLAVLVAAAFGATGAAMVDVGPAGADASDIVINELLYNAPETDPAVNPLVEFLELYNRGVDPVDISGWRFSAGIVLDPAAHPGSVFPAGTVIPAGGYLVGSSEPTVFAAQYGFAADFSFFGSGLSGSGETVTLTDASANTIDTVPYDDAVPWPTAPDGGGASLELSDPFADNSVAASWLASTTYLGTPRAQNSVVTSPPVVIDQLAVTPPRPAAGAPATVSARMAPGSPATLTYRVMFGSEVTIPFRDDAGSPGGANDGVYGAQIPGQGAGQLVRFHIDATIGGTPARLPAAIDTRPNEGYVVADPEENTAVLPLLLWFMADADYNSLIANPCDKTTRPAVVVWDGVVYDGTLMRIRGEASCSKPKKKWDVALPAGYTIDPGPTFMNPFSGPLDEFALQRENYPVPGLGWQTITDIGSPSFGYMAVRTHRNGSFYNVAHMLEKPDGSWRNRTGYDDGSFYKQEGGGFRTYASVAALAASGDWDKKTPDDGDFTDIWQLTQVLNQPASASKTAWIYQNIDIPSAVDYVATIVLLRKWDSRGKNMHIARDPRGRWQFVEWDLDGIFQAGADGNGDFIEPNTSYNKMHASLYQIPAIRDMINRRIRTLHDRYLVGTSYVDHFDAATVGVDADRVLDRQAWGGTTLAYNRQKVVSGVAERRQIIAKYTPSRIPVSQSAAPSIVINELHYNPVNGDEEFLELYNPSATESVDLSGWVIDAVGPYTIPPGTVILPRSYLVFVRNDTVFKARYPGAILVGGQFPGGLDGAGEAVRLLQGARVVDEVVYDDVAPWPTAPDGTGPSLELTNPTLDNSLAASWAASTAAGGTPGAQNSTFGGGPGPGPGELVATGATWRYLATGADQGTAWRQPGFADGTWPTGAAPIGFRNSGLATTFTPTNGRTTYYFRTTFTVANPGAYTTLSLDLTRDDGAVVYLNGTEVARSNLPTGAIGFTTKATASVDGAAETTPVTIALPVGALATGTNTLAIEVHQKGNSPGDLTMAARLTAG